MFDLVALARARGLERCAKRLAKLALPDLSPALDPLPPETVDVPTALGLMRRRGADPSLVKRILVWLESRPLELGLFSWDILCSAVLEPSERSLLEELRQNAKRVRAVLPAPGSTFVNTREVSSERVVDTVARPAYRNADDDALMHAATEQRALGALDELRHRYDVSTLIEAGTVNSTVEIARLLHLSHLPSLGSMYADYAFRVLRSRPALTELVEMLLDVGAGDSVPPPSEISPNGEAEQLDLLGYAAARAQIVNGNAAAVCAQLKSVMNTDYHALDIAEVLRMPRSHVVLADAAAEQDQIPVPFAIIDQIAQANPSWRYVHRVRAVMSGLVQETAGAELPLLFVDAFLDGFGNDFSLWYESGIVATGKPWHQKLIERAASEVAAGPHDFMAWVGLVSLIDSDERELINEVNARVATQCELTLAS